MQQKKSIHKRQVLLDAALDVFSVYGFNGASLDEIAQLAQMHKSNIFYYYENKEALYMEVLTGVLREWIIPFQDLQADLEPKEAISKYIVEKIEIAKAQPKASKLFALEIMQGATHISPVLQGPLKKIFKRKVRVIVQWQQQGKISSQIDPELFILNLWAITQNYADFAMQMEMVTGKSLNNKSMLKRCLAHTIHLLLYGMLPRTDADSQIEVESEA